MLWASVFYLGITVGLFILFVAIVIRIYSRRHRDRYEEPKHRMLNDD